MPLAVLGVIAGVGAAVSAVGQVKAGNAAKRAGEAAQAASNSEAQISDYNANVADLQAQDATQRGALDESRFRTTVRATIGSQRAGFAASGVDVGFGSAVDVQADAAKLGELDALQIRSNAAREAWGYEVQAVDFRNRGIVQRQEGVAQLQAGEAQQTASRFGAASSILGTGASLLESKYGFGKGKAA